MPDDMKAVEALCVRLESVRYQREDWHEPYGAIDLPCDADDYGAVSVARNPDGPEAAKVLRALLSERRKMVEALERASEAMAEAIQWDKARGFRMPYRVRDPLFAAIDRNKVAALTGSETPTEKTNA